MTGLDPDKEEIIEIYCILTTGTLDLIEPQGWGVVVHQSAARMSQMDAWCTRTHAGSGLTAAVIASTVTAEQAAEGLLSYIKKYIAEPRTAHLAGNSVHADRAFLRKGPYRKVVEHLHYRILDVSSLKEAAVRWCPRELLWEAPRKKGLHVAREDILESIEEARFYKERIFGTAPAPAPAPAPMGFAMTGVAIVMPQQTEEDDEAAAVGKA
jgi:oligoribonuclease (3'-5' exoribonuclease)